VILHVEARAGKIYAKQALNILEYIFAWRGEQIWTEQGPNVGAGQTQATPTKHACAGGKVGSSRCAVAVLRANSRT